MLKNRSVPVDTILPHLVYEDVGGALTWLAKAFGFTEHFRYSEPGGPFQGAQIHLGDVWIMLATSRPGRIRRAAVRSRRPRRSPLAVREACSGRKPCRMGSYAIQALRCAANLCVGALAQVTSATPSRSTLVLLINRVIHSGTKCAHLVWGGPAHENVAAKSSVHRHTYGCRA